MVVNPSGTLLFRPVADDGREIDRQLLGVYGLVMAMKGIAGEHQYLCEARCSKEGVRFRIDTADGVRPPLMSTPSNLHLLGDLTTSPIWKIDPSRPGVGLAFLRKTSIPASMTGREMYLVAAVFSVDSRFSPPGDALIDLRFGSFSGRPEFHTLGIGGSPDQALAKPFFLNEDGERYAIASTLPPESIALIRSIGAVCSKPLESRTVQELSQFKRWSNNLELSPFIQIYERPRDPLFLPCVSEMQGHQLPTDQLLSAEDLKGFQDGVDSCHGAIFCGRAVDGVTDRLR